MISYEIAVALFLIAFAGGLIGWIELQKYLIEREDDRDRDHHTG